MSDGNDTGGDTLEVLLERAKEQARRVKAAALRGELSPGQLAALEAEYRIWKRNVERILSRAA